MPLFVVVVDDDGQSNITTCDSIGRLLTACNGFTGNTRHGLRAALLKSAGGKIFRAFLEKKKNTFA